MSVSTLIGAITKDLSETSRRPQAQGSACAAAEALLDRSMEGWRPQQKGPNVINGGTRSAKSDASVGKQIDSRHDYRR